MASNLLTEDFVTVTVKNKTPLVVPPAVRRRAGLAGRSQLEIRANGGVITITAKPPAADDEYTPEQRRIIDARLAESADDLKKGRTFGPFNTAEEMIASMKKQLKKRSTAKTNKRSR